MRNKNNNKEVGGQAKKNVSNSFVLPHQHMVAMTSDENALWLPQNAGNLFTELQDLISLFAHSKCWHVCDSTEFLLKLFHSFKHFSLFFKPHYAKHSVKNLVV